MRRLRLHLLLATTTAMLAYVSYEGYAATREAAEMAQRSLQTNREQAKAIQRIRARPVFAATAVEKVSDLTRRIAVARNTAAIPEQAVDLVDPQSPVRLGDSQYRQRPVSIDLRGLNLSQAVRFVDGLTDRESGIWVNQIRLSPVRGETNERETELWNVELVLTQVNYSPKSQ